MPQAQTKAEKIFLWKKVKVKVIDLIVTRKSIFNEVCMPNLKSIFLGYKVKVKIKVDNWQADIQDKNNMPLIIQSRDMKINKIFFLKILCQKFVCWHNLPKSKVWMKIVFFLILPNNHIHFLNAEKLMQLI